MMSNLTDKIYDSGGTRRYHNRPKLNQNVREHSWGVAVIIITMHPNPTPNLLRAAILHDCSESVYGDFVSPAKVAFPELRELDNKLNSLFWEKIEEEYGLNYPHLTTEEKLWLDFADMYECFLFAQREGNDDVSKDAFERSLTIALSLSELGFNLEI